MSEAPERIWIEDEFGDDGYPHLSLEAADRIEQLTAQNLRLSGLCYDLKKEVAISDALLISEAEVSLERLARAEAAEAERDRLREALTDAWDAHNKHGDQMSGWWVHDDALKGETT